MFVVSRLPPEKRCHLDRADARTESDTRWHETTGFFCALTKWMWRNGRRARLRAWSGISRWRFDSSHPHKDCETRCALRASTKGVLPYRSLGSRKPETGNGQIARVAQWQEASLSKGEGCGFESRPWYWKRFSQKKEHRSAISNITPKGVRYGKTQKIHR